MLNLKNTLDGYLKNVEVIGNTIQDTNNLANIRSVGDKVEGQELYKIDVVSCGKNLLKFDNNTTVASGVTFVFKNNKILLKGTPIADSVSSPLIPIKKLVHGKSYKLSLHGGNSKIFSSLRYTNNEGKVVWANNFVWDSSYRDCVAYIDVKSNGISVDGYELGLQLEEGTQVTPYEPYQEQKLEILSPVQLEKVGDVADRIIYKDGVWGIEKNIGNLVLDGKISPKVVSIHGVYSDLAYIEYTAFDNYMKSSVGNVFVQGFTYKQAFSASTTGVSAYNCAVTYTMHKLRLLIPCNDLTEVNINGVNNYFSNKPCKVSYIAEQPQFIPLPHDQQVKLRTFAGQTNIAFLTEIPGQVKAQVPKSLGATVNTHTEQIADLHNSLERVKKLEETTVSTVETESGFTTVDATNNGYFEGVKLEGKSLVNLADKTRYTPTIEGWKTNLGNMELYKANTTYTFMANVTTLADGVKLYIKGKELKKGHNIVTFTTNNTIDSISIYSVGTPGTFVVDNVLILEGDHTNNPPSYFEGLVSVGQDVEEVSVESKNSDETQINKKPLLYYNPTTETWEKPILREWDTIEKHSDGKYYYHKRSGEVVLNGSENWLVRNDLPTDNPQGTHLVFYVQDENFPIKVRPNDISSIVWISDIIQPISHTYGWNTSVEGLHFGTFNISQGANNCRYFMNIAKSRLTTQDVAGFKQWLQANHVTVVYQLAKEEVYECTNIDLMTYSKETNYIINSGAISPKSLLKVHNNISNVVKILQEKVSLLENTFIAGLKSVLSGDMYSLATILYPEDFEQNDNTEQDIMVIPE